MHNVLFVTSSPFGSQSHSQRIARGIVDDLKIQDPSRRVVVRDLANQPVPHASEDFAIGRDQPLRSAQRCDTARAAPCPTRWWTSSPRPTSS